MTGPGVVVVGGGQAGFAAVDALRRAGFAGRITLVEENTSLPYQRPPLSKAYLAGDVDADSLPFRPASYFADAQVDLVLGARCVDIDVEAREITHAAGRIAYDDLVIATGSVPRPATFPGHDLPGVHRLHDRGHSDALREALVPGANVVVVGGGFIGLEVASVARKRGLRVTVLEAAPRLMERVLSLRSAVELTRIHREEQVDIRCGSPVARLVAGEDGRVGHVELATGELVAADVVVLGIGSVPALRGQDVGLEADASGAIWVDAFMQTSAAHVYACGDGVSFEHRGRRVRLESVQNATDQARCAAAAITGSFEAYDAVPWFWTEQHGVKVQIAGLLDASDQWVEWVDPRGGRAVLSFQGQEFLGSESFGSTAAHMATRSLLRDGASLTFDEASSVDFDLRAAARRARTSVA